MPFDQRQRVRLDDLTFQRHPDGRYTVDVHLELRGTTYPGLAHGVGPLEGELRTSALATLEAATAVAGKQVVFTLTGIKSVRAFDSLVIIAAVHAQAGERHWRLMGVKSPSEGEKPVESAARAVLDAINRVLELYVRQAAPPEGGAAEPDVEV